MVLGPVRMLSEINGEPELGEGAARGGMCLITGMDARVFRQDAVGVPFGLVELMVWRHPVRVDELRSLCGLAPKTDRGVWQPIGAISWD